MSFSGITRSMGHLFNTEVGMTKASELLVHTDFSIEEVAHASGYTSSASFIKAFRQKYKTTPLQFRTDARLRTATKHIVE